MTAITVGQLFIPGVAGKQVVLKKVRYFEDRSGSYVIDEYQVLICDSDGVRRDTYVNGQPSMQVIHLLSSATNRQKKDARREAYRTFWQTMMACASWSEDLSNTT